MRPFFEMRGGGVNGLVTDATPSCLPTVASIDSTAASVAGVVRVEPWSAAMTIVACGCCCAGKRCSRTFVADWELVPGTVKTSRSTLCWETAPTPSRTSASTQIATTARR